MTIRWENVKVVARRDFLAVVKRKAYIFTAIGLPAYFAVVTFFTAAPQVSERIKSMRELKTVGVVDSSGLYAGATDHISSEMNLGDLPFASGEKIQKFETRFQLIPDMAEAENALRSERLSQVVVIPPDYLETGRLRRYARTTSMFSSADRGPIREWLVRGLMTGADSTRLSRAVRPTVGLQDLTLDSRSGQFVVKDDRRELADFMLPFGLAMLLGLAIVTGGQYLLQGLAEEKESRILESLLCAVTPDELLWGKMLGLGSAGLLLVLFWAGLGSVVAGPALMLARPDPMLLVAGLAYFTLGYLLYASLLMAVGSVASNLREATQMSFVFTFMNFVPIIMLTSILSNPNSTLALVLSLFPPTAPTTMMMRMAAPGAGVPLWQLGLSLALMVAGSMVVLRGASRVFRIGLLMYGKTPTLPEILRWARQA